MARGSLSHWGLIAVGANAVWRLVRAQRPYQPFTLLRRIGEAAHPARTHPVQRGFQMKWTPVSHLPTG
jgi:hypothetical protein